MGQQPEKHITRYSNSLEDNKAYPSAVTTLRKDLEEVMPKVQSWAEPYWFYYRQVFQLENSGHTA